MQENGIELKSEIWPFYQVFSKAKNGVLKDSAFFVAERQSPKVSVWNIRTD